jgi:hypothetical protein
MLPGMNGTVIFEPVHTHTHTHTHIHKPSGEQVRCSAHTAQNASVSASVSYTGDGTKIQCQDLQLSVRLIGVRQNGIEAAIGTEEVDQRKQRR